MRRVCVCAYVYCMRFLASAGEPLGPGAQGEAELHRSEDTEVQDIGLKKMKVNDTSRYSIRNNGETGPQKYVGFTITRRVGRPNRKFSDRNVTTGFGCKV